MQWFALIIITVLCAIWLIRSIVGMSRRTNAVKARAALVMRDRERLTSQGFAEAFFPSSQQAAARVVYDTLHYSLITDVQRMRPEDQIIADLGLAKVDGLDVDLWAMDIEKLVGVDIRPLFDGSDCTVGRVVAFIAETQMQQDEAADRTA